MIRPRIAMIGVLACLNAGRAIANARDEGFTKLIFDAESHRVVGGGIVGTGAGDLIAEEFRLGYLLSAGIFGVAIAAITLAHWRLAVNAVLAFWIAYV